MPVVKIHFATWSRVLPFLPLNEYREPFAAVASEGEIRQFDESLALGNKIVPIRLLRRYADQLDI